MHLSGSDEAFSITPADVLSAKEALRQVVGSIEDALDKIESENRILLGGWDGDAQQEFLRRQAKWNSDAIEIKERLRQLVAGIESAVNSYVGADRQGASIIARRA
jgi:WXG100 family type VII secretion target